MAAERLDDFASPLGPASPDAHFLERSHFGVTENNVRCQFSRADHQQSLGIRSCQVSCGERGGCARTAQCQLVAVQHCSRGSGIAVEQHVTGVNRRQAAQRVIREYRYELHANSPIGAPAGHEQQGLACVAAVANVITLAHWGGVLGGKSAFQAVYERAAFEARGQFGTI